MVDPAKMMYLLAVLVPLVAAIVQSFRLLDQNGELASVKRDLADQVRWRREAEQEASKARKDLAVLEEAVRGLADRISGDD